MATLLDEVDTMLSESQPIGEAADTSPVSTLFSTYLVSAAYFAETSAVLLLKMFTSRGEPFYIVDAKKTARPLVCGVTEVFLTPYVEETACVDECEGLPVLHLVPESVADALLERVTQSGICAAGWFSGLVFVSSVAMQIHHRSGAGHSVHRVALDRKGAIEPRTDTEQGATCDYPVPYLLIDEALFSAGEHTGKMVEVIGKVNAMLIDSLCRMQYSNLHAAECAPDELDETLHQFMGRHSHLVRNLLESSVCEDSFVNRERKAELDTLVRLMMQEVEIVEELKSNVARLRAIEKLIPDGVLCPTSAIETPAPPPLVIAENISEILVAPLMDDDDEEEDCVGSSGSECSR